MSSNAVKPHAEFAIYIGAAGTDAPTLKIVPDGHGGWKIVKVPGWNPEGMLEFHAAAKALSAALTIKNPEVSHAVMNATASFMHAELSKFGGHEAGGTVVVVGG